MEIGFRWDFAYEILPTLIRATGNTILAAGIGYLIAVLVGLVFLLAAAYQTTTSRTQTAGKVLNELALARHR